MTKENKTTPIVLRYEGYQIRKDPMCFIVAEESAKPTIKNPMKAGTYTYHPTLVGAIQELSKRIFNKKLEKRSTDGETDFESLVLLIQNHNKAIENAFILTPESH